MPIKTKILYSKVEILYYHIHTTTTQTFEQNVRMQMHTKEKQLINHFTIMMKATD